MAALHTLALMAGVNKSKEGNAYVQQNKTNTEGGVLCSSYRQWMLICSFMSRFKSRPLWWNRQELAHAETLPLRVAKNPLMGYADIGGRCALSMFGGHVLPHTGQAVPPDGRSKRTAPFCRGKLQVTRRSYCAA